MKKVLTYDGVELLKESGTRASPQMERLEYVYGDKGTLRGLTD